MTRIAIVTPGNSTVQGVRDEQPVEGEESYCQILNERFGIELKPDNW